MLSPPVIHLFAGITVPWWTSVVAGFLLIIALQTLVVALGLTVQILFDRSNLSFLPARDFRFFIGTARQVYERAT